MLKTLYKKVSVYLFLAVAAFAWTAPSWAIPVGSFDGNRIILIDGNGDANTSIKLLSGSTDLVFGYYLNESSTFAPFSGIDFFNDRDVLDLALKDGSVIYRASGDLDDPTYSLAMDFAGDVSATPYFSQEPLPSWLNTYYSSLTVQWNLPAGTETSMNFALSGNGDGMAPVPEPASLILMGSGLAGLGLWRWKRSKNSV